MAQSPVSGGETTLLIVDDEPMMLGLLRRLFEHDETIVVAGEAANGREAVDAWRSLRPDIVILDHRMPVLSGLDAAREILAEAPEQRIILFSTQAWDPTWVQSVLELGVSACLSKTDVATILDVLNTLREA